MTDKGDLAGGVPGQGRSGHAPPAKRVPRVTVVLLALSISFIVAWVVFDWHVGDAFFLPMVLGVIGAVWALCCRSMELGDRIGWAIISAASGFVILGAVFYVGTLLWGP